MLRKFPGGDQANARIVLSTGTRWLLWTTAAVDVMVAVWMAVVGDRLDPASPITRVITLGGHPLIVLGLALVGFALLAVLAPLTRGFAVATPWQLAVIPVAGLASVVALAGLLSVGGLAVGALLLIALLFGGRPPTRIDVRQRR